eukprot:GGOE01012598.1.p6 GENE.GGOE01012598.1~~GGOE01012598.1.p6  ORF type:complete len:126 (+),score=12.36 GGOE01012598.1:1090-1467(+)
MQSGSLHTLWLWLRGGGGHRPRRVMDCKLWPETQMYMLLMLHPGNTVPGDAVKMEISYKAPQLTGLSLAYAAQLYVNPDRVWRSCGSDVPSAATDAVVLARERCRPTHLPQALHSSHGCLMARMT